MKKLWIGLAGSSLNPPHRMHVAFLQFVLWCERFDIFVWFPAGQQFKKLIHPYHRTNMMQLAFPQDWLYSAPTEFFIDWSWIQGLNRPTISIFQDFENKHPDAEMVWVTGADSVTPRSEFGGLCEIEARWTEGPTLMREKKFLILARSGFPHPSALPLPPQFEWMDSGFSEDVQSNYIRELIERGEPFEHLVPDAVAAYIKRYHLYGYEFAW